MYAESLTHQVPRVAIVTIDVILFSFTIISAKSSNKASEDDYGLLFKAIKFTKAFASILNV